jgi:hypothetical protein
VIALAFVFGLWLGGATYMIVWDWICRDVSGRHDTREWARGAVLVWLFITWPGFLWRSYKREKARRR